MGRGRKKKRMRPSNTENYKAKVANQSGDAKEVKTYENRPTSNKKMEDYYREQGVISEKEFEECMAAMRRELPVTFRITGSRSEAFEVKKVIEGKFFSQLTDIEVEGIKVEPPQQLSWYPDGLAWQLNVSRRIVRRSPELNKLHQFLVCETENGNISRQEAVSMLPPLCLDVQPHHVVLDMCAAPGSKTAQLIEALHTKEEPVPEGLVVANDSDNRRCYLLMHQARRLHSPSFLITNQDAAIFPSLRLSAPGEEPVVNLEYDRVLADVPCSGDGTIRKNYDVWWKWNANNALGLHALQVRILRRGLELLKPGGKLVYSTCSLNPMEDEAVVAALIRKSEGAVELIDASESLPGLKYKKGLSSWKLQTKEGVWFTNWDEVPERQKGHIRPTMFPGEGAESLGLERCIRVLPHMQDTGGFFVAVLRKTRHLPWSKQAKAEAAAAAGESEEPTPAAQKDEEEPGQEGAAPADVAADEEGQKEGSDEGEPAAKRQRSDDTGKEKQKQKPRWQGHREDPFFFMDRDDKFWQEVKDFFSFSDATPVEQLMYRSATGKRKNIYFVSPNIRRLAQNNADRVKFINMGIQAFKRNEHPLADCNFRLNQGGIHALAQYVEGRRMELEYSDLVALLQQEAVRSSNLSAAVLTQMDTVDVGSCIFVYKPSDEEGSLGCPLILTGWRGPTALRAFINKFEKGHLLRLCGFDLPEGLDALESSDTRTPGAAVSMAEDPKAKEESGVPQETEGDKSEIPKDDQRCDDASQGDGSNAASSSIGTNS